MHTKRQNARGLSQRSVARAAFFALPVVVAVGIYVYAQFSDAIWQSVAAISSSHIGKAPLLEGSPLNTPRANETAGTDAESASAVQSSPAALRRNHVQTQRFTRPLQALPQWHRFPSLPDGIKAKGPVGAEMLLTVATDGTVIDAFVLHTSGSDWLDQQGVDWVKAHWRYRPALAGTKPVVATTSAVVIFEQPKKGWHRSERKRAK